MRAWTDAMPDPQVLLEAVRDPAGNVCDFRYRDLNPAACERVGRDRADLLGRSVSETLPSFATSGLLAHYIRCLDIAEPVELDDLPISARGQVRRFDIRAAPAGADLLAVAWRDVSDRFELNARLADSEEHFRLLADNSSDVILRIRDYRIIWVSPSVEPAMGAPPDHWNGRSVVDIVAPEDMPIIEQILDETAGGATSAHRLRVRNADGTLHWIEIHVKLFYDREGTPDGRTASFRVVDEEVAAERESEAARQLQAAADARYRRLIDSSIVATNLVGLDGRFMLVNQAMCDFVGYDADTLLRMSWRDVTALDDLDEAIRAAREILAGTRESYRTTAQYIHSDGRRLWGELSVSCIRSTDGAAECLISQIVDVTREREVRRQLDDARRRQASTAALYRRSMECAAVGMCLVGPDGNFIEVNDAACEFFGYDADALVQMTWQQLTAPDYLVADTRNVNDLLTGRRDTYRITKQYIHADGSLIWGDLSVGCMRGPDGQVEVLVAQITDVTDEVRAREELSAQQQRNRELAEELTSEICSAADYVVSTLPGELGGQVEISSRHLPSLELGGDCFNYAWLDDDHLMIYLIDISGHGVKPALLSMSVHNLLRSGSFPTGVLLKPDRVLTRLNTLFQMEDQDGAYFTMWYGIYEASSRILLYCSAGHPPALAFAPAVESAWQYTSLGSGTLPVGVFEDTAFETASYTVAPGTRILLFSDGAFEIPLPDGRQSTLSEFADLTTRLLDAGDFSIDTVIEELRSRTVDRSFDDDCSLITAEFH